MIKKWNVGLGIAVAVSPIAIAYANGRDLLMPAIGTGILWAGILIGNVWPWRSNRA